MLVCLKYQNVIFFTSKNLDKNLWRWPCGFINKFLPAWPDIWKVSPTSTETPRSDILTWPSMSRSKLAGFISRWIICWKWTKLSWNEVAKVKLLNWKFPTYDSQDLVVHHENIFAMCLRPKDYRLEFVTIPWICVFGHVINEILAICSNIKCHNFVSNSAVKDFIEQNFIE